MFISYYDAMLFIIEYDVAYNLVIGQWMLVYC